MKKVTQLCAELAAPFVEAAGCTLWDVEYVREAGTWYLRVFIDAPGGVNIDQCEEVSRVLSDKLDEEDPIEGSYTWRWAAPARTGRSRSRSISPPIWASRWTEALPSPGRPQGVHRRAEAL